MNVSGYNRGIRWAGSGELGINSIAAVKALSLLIGVLSGYQSLPR